VTQLRRPVHLALGSNLGDRLRNLRAALMRLADHCEVAKVSAVYLTEPVGGVDQPAFYNAACTVLTDETPVELLRRMQRIEWEMGRRPALRWGPRPLDLDLLLDGTEVIDTGRLQVPHPRLAERAFVLAPLNEIAPDAVHPLLGSTMAELLRSLPAVDRAAVQRISAPDWAA
jgi:2-amino-4-hydroxy-6-hydroxymethyldihydropteridine diphosphokinase